MTGTHLPAQYGGYHIVAFYNDRDLQDHIALLCGDVTNAEDGLMRLHSECLTGTPSARCAANAATSSKVR